MQDAVAASFGSKPVPAVLQSRRFYFQQWILALIKYLQSADDPSATLAQIDANPVDANDLFFDSAGGGFETGTYVHRASVNAAQQPPTAVSVTTNLTTSVINDFDFARYNFRGESALYGVLSTSSTDYPGAEALYLSNIVGSPVLASVYGSYDCAINLDPHNANCGGIVAPTDPYGHPLFQGYAPAFGHSVFNIAANGAPSSASAMQVATVDFTLIQSAMVTLPVWSNPFDPTSATPQDKTTSVLLPYKPKGANVGFPVTIDGSRDKFYNTENVDFTGTTVNGNVDFEHVVVTGADGGAQDQIVIRAIETQNYLGLVFVCAQPSISPNAAPGQQDVLAVRMYQNGQDILDWLSSHPGAQSACNIQIKYSVYGNFADFISSLTNGVRISLNPGFGGSVVSDVTLFDPNVVATLGQ